MWTGVGSAKVLHRPVWCFLFLYTCHSKSDLWLLATTTSDADSSNTNLPLDRLPTGGGGGLQSSIRYNFKVEIYVTKSPFEGNADKLA